MGSMVGMIVGVKIGKGVIVSVGVCVGGSGVSVGGTTVGVIVGSAVSGDEQPASTTITKRDVILNLNML